MSGDLILLAVMVGAANWVFRALPMIFPLPGAGGDGPFGRFLGATGPAAIATLFVASVLPEIETGGISLPLVAGTGATIAVYFLRPSVALATVAGAVAYGVAAAFSL